MRDTSQFFGLIDHSGIESPRRMTFYEVCLTSNDELPGGDHLTELADLREALESIYARRAERPCGPRLPLGFGASLGVNLS
jgi:hypothetical protein